MKTPASASPTILLVDDQMDVLAILQRMLRPIVPEHYALVAVATPDAAHTYLADHPVALLIADYKLQGSMDGAQLCAAIKACSPNTFTVLISGYTLPPTMDQVDYVLTKPFRQHELSRIVDVALVDAIGADY